MTSRLRRALEEQKASTQQEVLRFTGILGIPLGGSRVVEVPSRKGYVYVRLRDNPNEVIQAFNNQVAPSYNLPVIVERFNNKYVIAGVDTERYENNWNSYSPYLPRHGNTHSFDIESGGGGDIVWVYPRQFMPLLVFPSGSLGAPNVIVASYTLKKDNGTWSYVGNTGTQSFAPYRPSSSTGAVMGLVYLNTDDGNPYFLINSGSVFSNAITGSSQIFSYIPQITNPNNQIPLAAIRLITGTSQISWDNIYDVRQFVHNQPTGTSGGGSITVQDEGVSQGAATVFNFVGDNVQATVSGGTANIFITGSAGGGSINTGTLDARYLKLDASNDPITGELVISPTVGAPGSYALRVAGTDRQSVFIESYGNFSQYNLSHNGKPGLYLDQEASGTITNYPAIGISRYGRVTPSTILAPAITIDDTTSLIDFYGGTIQHTISGSYTIFRANPQATGTVIPYLFNTQYPKPTGTHHTSWQVAGNEIAYLDISGTFYSTGEQLTRESQWIPVYSLWTYASATTINIPSGGTSVYQVGDRVRWKQGGSFKYGTVAAVASTLLTLDANSDYSVANSAITDVAYSRATAPLGFPGSFNWSPTPGGHTVGNGTVSAKFQRTGYTIDFWYSFTLGSTSSISGDFSISLPATPAIDFQAFADYSDIGSAGYTGFAVSGIGVLFCRAVNVAGTYAANGVTLGTPAPFAWGTSDVLRASGRFLTS